MDKRERQNTPSRPSFSWKGPCFWLQYKNMNLKWPFLSVLANKFRISRSSITIYLFMLYNNLPHFSEQQRRNSLGEITRKASFITMLTSSVPWQIHVIIPQPNVFHYFYSFIVCVRSYIWSKTPTLNRSICDVILITLSANKVGPVTLVLNVYITLAPLWLG